MATTIEQQIFDLVHQTGETLSGNIHIIDMTEEYPCYEEDKKYRVYHSDGYCFDVERLSEADDQTDEVVGYDYTIYDEWDGFDKVRSYEVYMNLIKTELYNTVID